MEPTHNRNVTIPARPESITIDTARTAALVVDMQNDFGAKGGMFDRAGIDISITRAAIEPTTRTPGRRTQGEASDRVPQAWTPTRSP